jgi:hypothetical protein
LISAENIKDCTLKIKTTLFYPSTLTVYSDKTVSLRGNTTRLTVAAGAISHHHNYVGIGFTACLYLVQA